MHAKTLGRTCSWRNGEKPVPRIEVAPAARGQLTVPRIPWWDRMRHRVGLRRLSHIPLLWLGCVETKDDVPGLMRVYVCLSEAQTVTSQFDGIWIKI